MLYIVVTIRRLRITSVISSDKTLVNNEMDTQTDKSLSHTKLYGDLSEATQLIEIAIKCTDTALGIVLNNQDSIALTKVEKERLKRILSSSNSNAIQSGQLLEKCQLSAK